MHYSEIFYWVLNMSISGAIMGIIIYFLSKISRVPRKIICFLWSIPCLRMWLPIGIGSKYSLLSIIFKCVGRVVPFGDSANAFSLSNFVAGAKEYFPIVYKNAHLEKVFLIAAIIWMTVAVLLIIITLWSYLNAKKEIKKAVLLKDNIYILKGVHSPMVCGIISPKIILPENMPHSFDKIQLGYILKHEKVHIKRLDNLWRFIGILTAVIHWFNPFCWLFLKVFLRDIELACDEAVLKKLSFKQRKEYAFTLLESGKNKGIWASAFGGASIRLRIEKILSYKSLSIISFAAFLLLALVIGYILLTNPSL